MSKHRFQALLLVACLLSLAHVGREISSNLGSGVVQVLESASRHSKTRNAPPLSRLDYWLWNYSSSSTQPCTDNATRKSLLHHLPHWYDATIELSPCVPRPWIEDRKDGAFEGQQSWDDGTKRPQIRRRSFSQLSTQKRPKPQVKLLLTNFGWNHPNQTHVGLATGRTLRQQQLLQALVDHPLFDALEWEEITNHGKDMDQDVRYYVFLDVETCFESNYPNYGGSYESNSDTKAGRSVRGRGECYNIQSCSFIKQALDSPLFQQARGLTQQARTPSVLSPATLVYFDCRGNGPPLTFRQHQTSNQIALVSLSSGWDQLHQLVDQGMPPPAVSRILLSGQELQHLNSCNESNRPYLLTFVGAYRGGSPRGDIVKLHNESARIISLYKGEFAQRYPNAAYNDMLKQSQFAATPRGDNRFSYRFTEVLAAGAIPVVHSDGWVLPFRTELIDWANECAVVIPESNSQETAQILRSISDQRRCQMRQRCYDIYSRYMATPQGTLQGILQGLELVARKGGS